jgi:hypothetical protein
VKGSGTLSCQRRAFGKMKKRTEKLLSIAAWMTAQAPIGKSFLALFFKKEMLS